MLNEYGRAQSELLLSSIYGGGDDLSDSAAGGTRRPGSFWASLRSRPGSASAAGFERDTSGTRSTVGSSIGGSCRCGRTSGLDLRIGAFRAAAELGYSSADATTFTELAQITRSTTGPNLIGREFWAGVETSGGDGLLRAGRINLPFGLRNLEHTSFVRSATQTDINEDQTYGVAFALSQPAWRAEVMALLGNLSVHPDAYRERGGAGYLEVSLAPTSAVGISGLAARSDASLATRLPTLRQAYGGFARLSPWQPVVVQVEADLLLNKQLGAGSQDVGHAEWLQTDVEVFRGLHLLAALEGHEDRGLARPAAGSLGRACGGSPSPTSTSARTWSNAGVEGPSTLTVLVQANGYL